PASSAGATGSEPNPQDRAPADTPNATSIALRRQDDEGTETGLGAAAHERHPRGVGPLSAAALAGALLASGLYWTLSRDSDVRWFAEEAVPEIEAYLDAADWESAYVLAKEA